MDNEEKIKEMEHQISNLETELQATKEHLKKYTAPFFSVGVSNYNDITHR